MARQKNYDPGLAIAMVGYAMLGRTADAKMMFTHRRARGWNMTLSEIRKRSAHLREQDIELYLDSMSYSWVYLKVKVGVGALLSKTSHLVSDAGSLP